MMPDSALYVVTGAFGYSGKYITTRLLAAGHRVRTLTNSPGRPHPFGTAVDAHPYDFDRPDDLARSLEGARVLINTYWVRFDHRDFTHGQAVRNTLRLFEAAVRAGVPRIVHVSITNPSEQSRLPYFRCKAELEAALRASGHPVVDAVGPETFTYRGIVEAIGNAIGCRRPIISIPPGLGVAVGHLV